MAGFEAKIRATIPDSILYKALDSARRQVERRVDAAQKQMEEKVKTILIAYIKNSKVYEGLEGKFIGYTDGSDLQAEFGLTNEMAYKALSNMMEILLETIHVRTIKTRAKQGFKISIIVEFLNPDEYEDQLRNGEAFKYLNSGGSKRYQNVIITWMQWLLDVVYQIIEDYGITYQGKSGDGMTPIEIAVSRSGRAIMIRENFPYVLPKIAIPTGKAKNFIDEIAKKANLRQEILKIVNDIIHKQILKD